MNTVYAPLRLVELGLLLCLLTSCVPGRWRTFMVVRLSPFCAPSNGLYNPQARHDFLKL